MLKDKQSGLYLRKRGSSNYDFSEIERGTIYDTLEGVQMGKRRQNNKDLVIVPILIKPSSPL